MPTTEIDLNAMAGLLRAAHAGRSGAPDRLIRVCRPVVECNARRCAWRNTDPDDIVQEVWVRLIQNVDRIREPRALLGWLHVVTRRLAIEIGGRNARMIPTELGDEMPAPACTEEQAIVLHERRQVTSGVLDALDRLNDTDRRLLLLLNQDQPANYLEISRRVRRPIGSLGPTRRRLLDRLGKDPAVRRLQVDRAAV
ncbi:MAG: RNA polymerase sigma factor [Aeromicrobium sp.]